MEGEEQYCLVQPLIKECKEILTSVRNPRLKKFANSHAAYGKQAKYRLAMEKASLKKTRQNAKGPQFPSTNESLPAMEKIHPARINLS